MLSGLLGSRTFIFGLGTQPLPLHFGQIFFSLAIASLLRVELARETVAARTDRDGWTGGQGPDALDERWTTGKLLPRSPGS